MSTAFAVILISLVGATHATRLVCGRNRKVGPHSLTCLETLWKQAGCSADGEGSPAVRDDVSYWNRLPVRLVKKDMAFYRILAERGAHNREGRPYVDLCYGTREEATTPGGGEGETPECDLNEPGPHSMECLRRLWLQHECSLDGKGSPDNNPDNVRYWNQRPLSIVSFDMARYKYEADRGAHHHLGTPYKDLCFGPELPGPKPDNCDDVTRKGPHERSCLNKWWEEGGCSLAGKGSPKNSEANVNHWNNLTAGNVKEDMHLYKLYADENRAHEGGYSYYYMCHGDKNEDVCGGPAAEGPHDIECLIKLWTEAGCNEVGRGSPSVNKENRRRWDSLTTSEVKRDMQGIHTRASSDAVDSMDKTWKELCYGSIIQSTCGVSGVTEPQYRIKIYGGRDVKNATKWPWMVSLQVEGSGHHFCGGALIHPQWILTASHCVDFLVADPAGFVAVLGSLDVSEAEEHRQTRRMERVVLHEEYVHRASPFYIVNDVALIKLEAPAKLTNHVRTVCLPVANGPDLTNCHIVGWGRRETYGTTGGKLQESEALYMPSSTCINQYYPFFRDMILQGNALCAQGADRGRVCKGDSGGPLLCQQGSQNWVALGAASWAPSGCMETKAPFAYADVRKFLDWIKTNCEGCI